MPWKLLLHNMSSGTDASDDDDDDDDDEEEVGNSRLAVNKQLCAGKATNGVITVRNTWLSYNVQSFDASNSVVAAIRQECVAADFLAEVRRGERNQGGVDACHVR